MNTDMESPAPPPFDTRFQFSTEFSWDLITALNMNLKFMVFREKAFWPSITVGLSGWNMAGLYIIPKKYFTGSCWGITPFLTLSRELKSDMRFFLGAKYAMGFLDFQINALAGMMPGGLFDISSLSRIKTSYRDFAVFTGLNYLTPREREVTALAGYYLPLRKMYAGVIYSKKNSAFGIMLYPDSFLLVHLFVNLQFSI
ncbi:MAG TPA: hypothetical protein DC049_11420 [Spirochaetia bacterium]|nr:hypothetical protein [Spirochaetia bacterium]